MTSKQVEQWIDEIADAIEQSKAIEQRLYNPFIKAPELASSLVHIIANLKESDFDDRQSYFSACIFALEICISQLQAAIENESKKATLALSQVMTQLAEAIQSHERSLSFWLPVLNAFYDAHIELSKELKQAYFELVAIEPVDEDIDEQSNINSIRALLEELSNLSDFEIAEHFFAQGYAMPPEFFGDLVIDLCQLSEGINIAILSLLHPDPQVREYVIEAIDETIEQTTLSPRALTRLAVIKHWYPTHYHALFNRWIRLQRKKEVTFELNQNPQILQIKASEIDGGGSQGIFIRARHDTSNQLCGLLFNVELGIKDAWFAQNISNDDANKYFQQPFANSVALRTIDKTYLTQIANHFLAVTLEQGEVAELHLLAIQEALDLKIIPQKIAVVECLQSLCIEISPVTPDRIREAIQQTKQWSTTKRFTESWFIESASVDKIVNQQCSYIDGAKICNIEQARKNIFAKEITPKRQKWVFHFLWLALWLKSCAKKNERAWQDSALLAHAIHQGIELQDIPILQEICQQSIENSLETMASRRTHLRQVPKKWPKLK